MNDFAAAMAPKSDQINAQDLIAGDMTVTIAAVKVTPGTEQPVSIRLEGMDKVWRPCKTTGRILMAAWGPDTSVYVGRSVRLYLDPEVKWGGMKVGGIRIRAVSHIDQELKLALAESKQNRKLFTIAPLAVKKTAPPQAEGAVTADQALFMANREAVKGAESFRAWFNSAEGKGCRATGALTPEAMLALKAAAEKADTAAAEDPFGLSPVPTDTEMTAELEAERQAFERQRAAELAALDGQP